MKINKNTFLFLSIIILILILPLDYLTDSYYLWALLCLLSSFISSIDKNTYAKKIKIISFILSFIFLICLSYKSILKSYLYTSVLSGIGLYFIGYTIIPLLIIYSFYITIRYLLINIPNIEKYLNKKLSNNNIIKYLNYFIGIISIVTIFRSINNASYSDPTITLIFINSGIWRHWHPIGYSIYLFLTYKITGTYFSVYIVNSILYLLTYKYIFKLISKHYKERTILLFQLITIIFFQPFVYLHTPIKDIVFSICILGLLSYLYKVIYNETEKKDIIIGTLYVTGVLLFRHASIIPIIITFITIIIYLIKNNKYMIKNLIVTFGVSLLSFIIITYGVGNILKAEKNPGYVKYSTPIYMVSSFLSEDEDYLSSEDKKILEQMMPIGDYILAYDKYLSDTVSREWGIPMSRISNFDKYKMGIPVLKMNAKLFVKHPFKYIIKLSNIDSILYEITVPIDGNDLAPVIGHSYETAMLEEINYQSPINSILKGIEYLSGKIVIVKDIYWRGGFYQFAFIVLIVINIIKNTKKNILLMIPLIVIQMLLYISIPSQDPRFILPLIITLPFITVITLNNKRRRV